MPAASGFPWAPAGPNLWGVRGDALNGGSRLAEATLILFVVLLAAASVGLLAPSLGPAGGLLYYLVWLVVLASIPLAVLLGVSLRLLGRAVRVARPELRRSLLLARASFWIGLGVVLETIPLSLVTYMGSRFGASAADVMAAGWWGIAVLLLVLLPAVVVGEWSLLRLDRGRGARWGALYLAAWVPLGLLVPLLAIAATAAWTPPPAVGFTSGTPPGFLILLAGTGVEAEFVLLMAAALPAAALAPAHYRAYVAAGFWVGVAAILVAIVPAFLFAISPLGLATARPIILLGIPGLPWFTFGPIPAILEGASAMLLLRAYAVMKAPEPAVFPQPVV